MNTKLLLLPSLCLGGTALLLLPLRESEAFSRLGSNLSVNERDMRLFDNFSDASANDNTTAASQFPGQTGAELALWKGIVEWGSQAHGNGSGDTSQATLGSGGANFDAFWAGKTTAPGGTTNNVVSKINTCSSGVLAYCEAPFQNGWRIRFCDSWVWNDGPSTISSGNYDLQGVMTHEYGHALGLGHSAVNGTTMWPSVGSGSTATRSIEADDSAGVQAIYGLKSAAKPVITATVASAGTLAIHGTNFSATGNTVWFRPSASTTATLDDPRIQVSGLASNGILITVAIPATAGPGDVIVRNAAAGHPSVSNAFPTDLVGTFGNPPLVILPTLSAVSPAVVEALQPGTERTVTLSGTHLGSVEAVTLDGVSLAFGSWYIENVETITLDLPLADIGQHELALVLGAPVAALEIEVVAAAAPRLELASGEAGALVRQGEDLRVRVAGTPGARQLLVVSSSTVPSASALVTLALGNGFSQLAVIARPTIPAQGWLEISLSNLPDPGPTGQAWFAQGIELGPEHIIRRVSSTEVRSLATLHRFVAPGCLLAGEVPDHPVFKLFWPQADSSSFGPPAQVRAARASKLA